MAKLYTPRGKGTACIRHLECGKLFEGDKHEFLRSEAEEFSIIENVRAVTFGYTLFHVNLYIRPQVSWHVWLK